MRPHRYTYEHTYSLPLSWHHPFLHFPLRHIQQDWPCGFAMSQWCLVLTCFGFVHPVHVLIFLVLYTAIYVQEQNQALNLWHVQLCLCIQGYQKTLEGICQECGTTVSVFSYSSKQLLLEEFSGLATAPHYCKYSQIHFLWVLLPQFFQNHSFSYTTAHILTAPFLYCDTLMHKLSQCA